MKNVETEVKIHVPDIELIEQRLQDRGANLIHERVYERNVRYDLQDNSLTRRGVVVRLREDASVKLTYKEPGIIQRGIITREELEVEVSDFDVMEAILSKFGYTPAMFYEKYRTTYEYHDAEIVLDILPFGNFVEVEGNQEDIEWVLEQIGLQDAERRENSYAKLFDYVKHHLELNFRDLTFENFADIEIPESAFIAPGSIVIR